MVGWHHWLNGHEFEQAPGDSEGRGNLARGRACSSSRGCKELDMTKWLNNGNYYQKKPCTFLILASPQLGTVTPIDEETKSEEGCITCPMLCKRFELWSPSPCSACGVTLDGRQSPSPGHMALPGHAGTGGVPHSLQGTSAHVITANFWNRCKKELNPTTGLTSSDSCGQVSAEAGPWF